MSKHQRPGKRERETSVKAAIRKVRNAKMDATRKVTGLLREEQRLAKGYGKSSANRDKLKGGTGSVGFYGGRGFYSERAAMPGNGTIGRMTPDQATDRKTATLPFKTTAPVSSRFAEDTFPVEKPSLTVLRRKGEAGKNDGWRKYGTVRVRLPDPTAKK